MNELPETHDDSEQILNRMLRQLPLRRAPVTLESRLIGELERRRTLPWWHRGFMLWPNTARAAFVALCGALIGLTFLDGSWSIAGTQALNEIGLLSVSWGYPLVALAGSAGDVATLLLQAIPPMWVYGGLGLCALLYAALFGLGAAAYRSLYLQPSAAGDPP